MNNGVSAGLKTAVDEPAKIASPGSRPRLSLAVSDVCFGGWAVVFLLTYGYELFNFSLSIDEELHVFNWNWPVKWIEQGRWGMALLAWCLQQIDGMPVVSTALFGGGLLLAAAHLATLYGLRGWRAFAFGAVLIASPIWPHVAEFNTVSYGTGIAVALCAIGVRAVAGQGVKPKLAGLGLLVLACGIYQTVPLAAFAMTAGRFLLADDKQPHWLQRFVSEAAIIVAAAAVSYVVQKGVMHAVSAETAYIDIYWRVPEYASNPVVAIQQSTKASIEYLIGTRPLYLGFGVVFAVLPLVAFAYSLVRTGFRASLVADVVIFALVLGACFVPVFISVGSLPARAMVALPFLVALMVVRFPQKTRFEELALRFYLLVVTVSGVAIASQLFYSDHLARQRDQLLAARILVRLQDLRAPDKNLPVGLVGEVAPVPGVFGRRIEVFGASFFEQDGGNVWRVVAYFKILGAHYLEPVDITQMPEVLARAETMPTWPRQGSVARVGDVAVIKLGPLSYAQKARLCSREPANALCG